MKRITMQKNCLLPAALTLFLLTLSYSSAFAVTVPSSAEPSRVQKQITPPAPSKPVEATPEMAPAAAVEAPPGADKIQFVLKAVTIEGMTVYTKDDIAQLYSGMIGKKISLTDVYALAEKLSVKYRNDGYVLSQAIVPPQTIDNGHITLRVIEGFVDHVIIRSKIPADAANLSAYAAAIKASRPLNARVLEKYMLLINDLPGISARSVLSPSPATPDASDLTLVIDHKPYDLSLAADNRGSRYMGAHQFNTGIGVNNAFSRLEKVNIQLASAPDGHPHREMNYAGMSIAVPYGHEGTMVTASGGITSTAPGYALKQLDVTGIAHAYNVEVMHPFLRSRSENIYATLRFNYLDTSRSDNLGGGRNEDRMRVLRLGSTYQFSDSHDGSNLLNGEISKGLDIFNTKARGSPNMTRAGGDPEFFKATAEISRVQRLASSYDFFAGVTGQWSASPLLASEEFGVGGAAYGSAYDGSEITGRHGIALRAELRATNPVETPLEIAQPYGFYDVGKVWDPQSAVPKDRIRALASAGLGLRAAVNETISGSAEYAVPLTRKVAAENNKHGRLFIMVSAKF